MCAGDVCSATRQSRTNTWCGRGSRSWPVVTRRSSMAKTCLERHQPVKFVPCFWIVARGRSGQGYRGMADIHIYRLLMTHPFACITQERKANSTRLGAASAQPSTHLPPVLYAVFNLTVAPSSTMPNTALPKPLSVSTISAQTVLLLPS
jgi:hypothetical protein